MTFCTRCGKPVPEGVVFCPSCGQAVEVSPPAGAPAPDASAVQTGGPDVAVPPPAKRLDFCVKCGKEIAPEAAFCSACGTPRKMVAEPIRTSQASSAAAGDRAQKAMIIEIVAGIFGFLGIGHIYSGRTSVGIMLLIGWIIGLMILYSLGLATGGVLFCVALPIQIAVPVFSGIKARDYVRTHG